MVTLTIKQASKETGKDRTTLLRAIQKGTITAKKDKNNAWSIEASELFRVYERTPCTQIDNAQDSTSVHSRNTQSTHSKKTEYTLVDIELAKVKTANEFLERQTLELKERIKLLEIVISDLKQDKDTYRHQIKAITDQRPQTRKKRFLGVF